MTEKEIFLRHIGQTSQNPLMLHVVKAHNIYLETADHRRVIDLCSGVSVNNLGHNHPEIIKAIKEQVDKYLHVMVYGELIENPQVNYAKLLVDNLPPKLDSVYFVNSGSEAIEGAMKLAKRYTGRFEIISFWNAYHGSTHGALSLMGNLDFTRAFRPLLPDILRLDFGDINQLEQITEKTAAVVIEPIQAEAGVIIPTKEYMKALRSRCNQVGCLLIFDEVQTGFGRTGKLFAFEHFDVVPDILVIAKAAGGGMPIGAFIANKDIMKVLSFDPPLGHITTFGGHPVSAAAGYAALRVLIEQKIIDDVQRKGEKFIELLKDHPKIKSIRGIGLLIGVQLDNANMLDKAMNQFIANGLMTDRFLFAKDMFRIGPPLIITDSQIEEVVDLIHKSLDQV